jgi:Flp pilus assembly protein TadD
MLAVLEYRHGNCAAAVSHFEKAGELIDSQLDALHAYATCLMRIKRPEAAAATLQKSVALNPSDPRERQVLASVLLLVHKPQDALSALQPLPHSNKSFSVLRAVAMGCS